MGLERCASTGLTIPECSCTRCLLEQMDRFMPEALREDAGVTARAEVRVSVAPPDGRQRAA
ncbi:MAG: hypothetical protein QOG26_980 [Solirubrobacterales bacterium]|jgi:hypothetical protein|nr:hypothetical protein [Solirubrobacterales bacterium]MDX6651977.1 hypothetical protein [Solirubrobacterales bacterium]